MLPQRLLLLVILLIQANTWSQHNLIVRFNPPVNSEGNLLVYIYNKAEGFPVDKKQVFRQEIIPIKQTSEITIKDLAFDTYAIIVVIDANSNRKMDRNWLGMPAEEYAMSGKNKFRFGPPRFEDVKFDFVRNNQIIVLEF